MKMLTTINNITELLLRLIEIEGKIKKKKAFDLRWAAAYLIVSALWVVAAVVFFLIGAYQYLVARMSSEATSLFLSIVAIILALVFVYLAKSETN